MQLRNQFKLRPKSYIGLTTKGKSVTIPGQDFTPQEIIRSFTQGRNLPPTQYIDAPVSQFARMSIQDKMDYLKNLQRTNNEQKIQVEQQINKLKSANALKKQQDHEAQLREQIQKELQSKRDDDKTK